MGLTRNEWKIGLVLASAHGGQHLFYRLVPPLIPVLLIVFDLPLWQLGLLVSIYGFAGGLFQAPMGVLSDRYDRRFLLPPGFALMGAGYLLFSSALLFGPAISDIVIGDTLFAGEFLVMMAGMFLAGTGFSVVHPVGYPLISANVDASNKGTIFGMWGGVSKLGDATAPIIIGIMILLLSWNQILFAFGIVGFLYSVFLFIVLNRPFIDTLPESHYSKTDESDTSEKPSVLEGDRRAFLIPIGLIMLFFFSKSFTSHGLVTFTPVYIVDVYNFSTTLFGISFGPESVANLYFSALLIAGGVTQFAIGPLTDRYDHRTILVGLLSIATIGLVILTAFAMTPLTLLGIIIVIGCSLYGLNPARDALMSDIIPPEVEGRVFGYVWTMAMLVASIYPVLIGYIADVVGLQQSFTFLAAGTFVGAVFIGLLFSKHIYHPERTADIATG